MTKWEEFGMQDKILAILDVPTRPRGHHFGRPFLSPYQIAIRFKTLFPSEFSALNKPLGGKKSGQETSVTQYIANELSRRIKRKELPTVEGRFLGRQNLKKLTYSCEDGDVQCSTEQAEDLSIFRLKDI